MEKSAWLGGSYVESEVVTSVIMRTAILHLLYERGRIVIIGNLLEYVLNILLVWICWYEIQTCKGVGHKNQLLHRDLWRSNVLKFRHNLHRDFSFVRLPTQVMTSPGRAVAEAVRCWLSTAAARVRVPAACGVYGREKTALGQVFSEYFCFPCQSFDQFLHHHNHPGLAQ
jgi:hypothetical protein